MRISKNIYPSSFSNVRCLTKIEFLNVVKHRWKSQGAEPWCRLRSGRGGGGAEGVKSLKNFGLFYIQRKNK